MGKLSGKTIEAIAAYGGATVEDIGSALKGLRKLSGLTQVEMASRLDVQQSAVSKIENGGDVHLSTLKKYVEALGALLRIDASFSADTPLALHVRETFELEHGDDDQLVLPILGDEPFRPQRDVVISIRPQYSDRILDGSKTVELRRRFPVSAPQGTIAYIYSTSPVRAMVGMAQIGDILKLPVAEIWRRFSGEASISKEDFDKYFEGADHGFALVFEQVRPFSEPLPLDLLRERFGFEPPQSFLYAKHDLRKALKNEPSVVSN
ncbi:MAG: helix-turn-helix domain-containing protein [Bdellovibrionales bacterium]|nr:helix-turn-helix domain-containing protein [Bdellovibrionales bacterium]